MPRDPATSLLPGKLSGLPTIFNLATDLDSSSAGARRYMAAAVMVVTQLDTQSLERHRPWLKRVRHAASSWLGSAAAALVVLSGCLACHAETLSYVWPADAHFHRVIDERRQFRVEFLLVQRCPGDPL
jgi:hypothetical protein